MATDTTGEETKVDNQNTNQNVAFIPLRTKALDLLVADSLQDPPLAVPNGTIDLNLGIDLVPMNTISNLEENDTTECSKNNYGPVPTIEIKPPDKDENNLDNSSVTIDENSNIVNSTLDYLRPPSIDTTINIARPALEKNLDVSRLTENSTEEGIDLEVICHYSSTPVVSTPKSDRSISASSTSLLSITSASPIVSTDIPTPGGGNKDTPPFDVSQEVKDISEVCQELKESNELSEEVKEISVVSQSTYIDTDHKSNQNVKTSSNDSQDEIVNHNRYRLALYGESHTIFPPSHGTGGHCSMNDIGASCGLNGALPTPAYTEDHSGYLPCMQAHAACNFHLGRTDSWTDLSYQPDLLAGPSSSLGDPCCHVPGGCMAGMAPDSEYFVYPSIYVSSAGLISVLLRNDISVEMTVDRTIRVVSHNHMMAVATDSRGTAACLYHPAVKVFQMGTTTDIATQGFRAQMGGNDTIVFSNGVKYFRLEGAELQPTGPIKFMDILRDQSVNLLFSSEGYGESLVASCMQVAAQAEYANLPKGGVIVRINGVKVTQTGSGDVTVVTGAKFIRLSPNNGTTRLGNRFVDMEVEKDWSMKLTRGSHSFLYARKRAMVCNGKMEAGFDEKSALKVTNLAPRHMFLAKPSMVRRPARKPIRPASAPGPAPNVFTPRRRPGPPNGFGGRGGSAAMGSI